MISFILIPTMEKSTQLKGKIPYNLQTTLKSLKPSSKSISSNCNNNSLIIFQNKSITSPPYKLDSLTSKKYSSLITNLYSIKSPFYPIYLNKINPQKISLIIREDSFISIPKTGK